MFKFANPKRYQQIARPLFWLASVLCAGLFIWGLWVSLFFSPPDWQQSETVRIMYIHVPAAWMSLMTYSSMGMAGIFMIIWKHTLAGLYIRAIAPVGAGFTLICLITGAIWGEPTWGTWWVWDARLTSVLILLFLYIGVIALSDAYEDKDKSLMAASWLSLIGLINLPIIKFSVDWWNTLHQPASISSFARMAEPALHRAMLEPLLIMAGAYVCLFIALGILRLDNEIADRRIENLRMKQSHAQ